MKIAMVAAMANNNAIGLDNKMPWHLPEDLKYFKKITLGKPVIMGRKTHESIGFVLPGRLNIVVSRSSSLENKDVLQAYSLDEAISLAGNQGQEQKVEEMMIIGGAELYRQFLPRADRLYITKIYASFEADTFFPEINFNEWKCVSESRHQNHNSSSAFDYSFLVYDRLNRHNTLVL